LASALHSQKSGFDEVMPIVGTSHEADQGSFMGKENLKMTLYYNPFHQLRTEMDRLLSGFMGSTTNGGSSLLATRDQPAVNLWDENDSLKLEMELPGIKSEQIDISVAGDELTVKVKRPDVAEEGMTYHRRERPVGDFARVLKLPCEVNPDKVSAELHGGILTLTLAKAEAIKPRKITVVS
jgi:HSP20 family protein